MVWHLCQSAAGLGDESHHTQWCMCDCKETRRNSLNAVSHSAMPASRTAHLKKKHTHILFNAYLGRYRLTSILVLISPCHENTHSHMAHYLNFTLWPCSHAATVSTTQASPNISVCFSSAGRWPATPPVPGRRCIYTHVRTRWPVDTARP